LPYPCRVANSFTRTGKSAIALPPAGINFPLCRLRFLRLDWFRPPVAPALGLDLAAFKPDENAISFNSNAFEFDENAFSNVENAFLNVENAFSNVENAFVNVENAFLNVENASELN